MRHSRRAFLRASVAALACGPTGVVRAQDRFDQDALLAFETLGSITLLHIGDLHGQMMPHLSRPAEVDLSADGTPTLSGEAFRIRYGIGGGTPMDYAYTHEKFVAHAGYFGPIGGLDRVATVVEATRAVRPGALFLTGAQNGQGGLPDHPPLGQAVSDTLMALAPEVVRGDLALIERGGAQIGLIRTHIQGADLTEQIKAAQVQGAQVLICLSQNGLGADIALARSTPELDVILSCASAKALPEPLFIGNSHIIASGTQGRFVSRLDLQVTDGVLGAIRHKLIPMFSELIRPAPRIAALIQSARAPHADDLNAVIGQADALLFTKGSLTSTWDDVINAALMDHYGTDFALSPGFGWGNTVVPGQDITREDIYSLCGSANAASYQTTLTGKALKNLLETAARSSFHPAADQQTSGQMPRVGGLAYHLDIDAPEGARISEMQRLKDAAPLAPDQLYQITGWGAEMPPQNGPPLWRILQDFIRKQTPVGDRPVGAVTHPSKN